ncbi:hypothetical protein L208DRAFT_1436366 [Tricholoma matsutake]|nr:hypothetical protein L208DRAFT_1436366 [Tricholoma matsutake 945]
MGSGQSRPDAEEKVFQNETPISFSHDIVNKLSDRINTPDTTPERQSTLDAHIRSRIQDDLEHLKQEEENVRLEIERALEKENLDRERNMAGEASEGEDEGATGSIRSSASLLGDLEEVRSKVDKYQAKRDLNEFPDVKESGEAVISCYKANFSTPLDCWREVSKFKASVANVEQDVTVIIYNVCNMVRTLR